MIEIRRLAEHDLGSLLDYQEVIYDALENKQVFQRSTEDFIYAALGDKGTCYGAFDANEKMLGYRIVYYPYDQPNNLGLDLALPLDQIMKVAHWDTIAVHPDHRGRGISSLLNRRAITDIRSTPFELLLSTTSPSNPFGICALLKAGFRIVALREKYGGKLRFICARPVRKNLATGPEEVRCNLVDLVEIHSNLKSGLVATSIVKVGASHILAFSCPSQIDHDEWHLHGTQAHL